MSVITAAYLNTVVNYLCGAGAPTTISAIYLDLYNGDPQGSGSSVLSTITGSATRSSATASMGAASGGSSTNTSTITVTAGASAAATVSYVAFFDAATAGNLVMSHALQASKSVQSGDIVRFDTSSLIVSLS